MIFPAIFGILISSISAVFSRPSILTIVIGGGAKECFYETVDLLNHTGQIEFEFQVLQGGSYDIEVTVEDPDQRLHFNGERREAGKINITVSNSGIFRICFSNKFSYISDKTVYFELEVAEKPEEESFWREFLDDLLLLNSVDEIESFMGQTESAQSHIRNMNLQGFGEAEVLNQRVQWAAALMSLGLLVVSVAQVYTLRRFFENK